MYWLRVMALMFLVTGLTACGTSGTGAGDGDGGGNATTASKFGQVSLMEVDLMETTVMGTGTFGGTAEPQPVTTEQDFLNSISDNCTVATAGDPSTDPNPVPVPETTSLDAGAELTVEAQNSVYATLPKQTVNGSISYQTDPMNPPAPPLPDSGLTVTVPGAEGGFPAFTDAAFPTVPALTLTSPTNTASIDANTTFTWTSSGSNTAVVISAQGQNSAAADMSISCIAADDGTFAFPDATKTQLNDAGFTNGSLSSVGRMGFRVHSNGDAVLYLTTNRMTIY